MDSKKTGDYISTLRKMNNLTQKDLANRIGVTDKAISKWERGAGYPDISMLKPLAEILGITVNELLDGENGEETNTKDDKLDKENQEDNQDEAVEKGNLENTVTNVLVYADKIMKIKEYNKSKMVSAILATLLIIAIFVCLVVDIAVNRSLSWSYIVTGGCVLGGCLFIPPLLYKKRGFMFGLGLLTILLIPYLALIQEVTATTQLEWLWKLAFPISVTWLAIIWFSMIINTFRKLNKWFVISIFTLLCIPGNVITNTIVEKYVYQLSENTTDNYYSVILTSIGCVAVTGFCLVMGLMKHKEK